MRKNGHLLLILWGILIIITTTTHAFVRTPSSSSTTLSLLQRLTPIHSTLLFASQSSHPNNKSVVMAVLAGPPPSSAQDEQDIMTALNSVPLFESVDFESNLSSSSTFNSNPSSLIVHRYKFVKAAGMLKFLETVDNSDMNVNQNQNQNSNYEAPPQWIPIYRGEENLLVERGWSFLDPDENEPASAFDIDAANQEGLYIPKWGKSTEDINVNTLALSSLGFSLTPLSQTEIETAAAKLDVKTQNVLLYGDTDAPGIKRTHNGFDFSGSVDISVIPQGIFCNPISNLPLFSTTHLSPTTASSGWLSFRSPISQDHIQLVQPSVDSLDSRIEVICAKTKLHLGHYFGPGEGYCINAGALNFIPLPLEQETQTHKHVNAHVSSSMLMFPTSWRPLDTHHIHHLNPPMDSDISTFTLLRSTLLAYCPTETIALGAGCFWHVEYALRRLAGVISTQVGYAGGETGTTTNPPTYEQICQGTTGHAEVVQLIIDPTICIPAQLFDCFLSMHDPTKVRAHGKHAIHTGQYRSSIFVSNQNQNQNLKVQAEEALLRCAMQLQKTLSTEIYVVEGPKNKFWKAEDRHQLHDERVKRKDPKDLSTLSVYEWIQTFGRRTESVLGSSETMWLADDNDDGMARMMI